MIRSYAPDSLRHAGVTRTWALLGGLGVLLLVIGVLLADRLGRRLVGSVADLARTADRLATGDLTARAAPSRAPELRRVGSELNRLAGRIQDLLIAAREDAADLAHRLRTPITAMRRGRPLPFSLIERDGRGGTRARIGIFPRPRSLKSPGTLQ